MPGGQNGAGHGENPQGCVNSPKGRHIPTLMSTSVRLHGSEPTAKVSMWDRRCWGWGKSIHWRSLMAKPHSYCLQLPACSRALLQVSTTTTIKPIHRSAWHTELFSPCPSCRCFPVVLFNLNPQSHSRTCSALQRAELGQDV